MSACSSRPLVFRRVCALALGLCLAASSVGAAGPENGSKKPLRVGTSGDYRPFSATSSGSGRSARFEGFDIALVEAWAAERGHTLEWVPFRWPNLLARLGNQHFDFAASGITLRPERSALGRFSVPVAETGAIVLARTPERWSGLASLDRSQVRIAVNAGGHLERVAHRHFPRASLLAVPDNDTVLQLLLDEKVHAVLTDSSEAPHWQARSPQPLARLGPLTHDRKGWLVRADLPDLARDLDAWLLAREASGQLAAARKQWLGEGDGPGSPHRHRTGDPLLALLASVDERLSLMPLVGAVKRASGIALEVPDREVLVLDRALADFHAAAAQQERALPSDTAIRGLFRAQLEAAKQVQWRAVKDRNTKPDLSNAPDLDTALRPALLRIGTRIAELVLVLPEDLDADAVSAAAARDLRNPYLESDTRAGLVDAIVALSRSLGEARRGGIPERATSAPTAAP